MKKMITCLMIATLLFSAVGCSRAENYNLPVTEEPFESMETLYSMSTHATYNSEIGLYDSSDLVFIGMPTDTFTKCETIYYNLQGEQISEGSTERFFDYSTLRNVKILELIKGDIDESEIKVADMAALKTYEDGEQKIIGLPSGMSIQKKNVKYLYYVIKSNDTKNDYYHIRMDHGLINIDGLHENVNKPVDSLRFDVIKSKYAGQFTKYDRSAELVTE